MKCEKMINNIVECQQKEIDTHIEYLRATPICGIIAHIGLTHILKKGEINSVKELGLLETIFDETLGGIKVDEIVEANYKYKVKDIWPTLNSPDSQKNDPLKIRVQELLIKSKDEYDKVEFVITILNENGRYILVDGNARTVSFYERNKDIFDEMFFPVYIIDMI